MNSSRIYGMVVGSYVNISQCSSIWTRITCQCSTAANVIYLTTFDLKLVNGVVVVVVVAWPKHNCRKRRWPLSKRMLQTRIASLYTAMTLLPGHLICELCAVTVYMSQHMLKFKRFLTTSSVCCLPFNEYGRRFHRQREREGSNSWYSFSAWLISLPRPYRLYTVDWSQTRCKIDLGWRRKTVSLHDALENFAIM